MFFSEHKINHKSVTHLRHWTLDGLIFLFYFSYYVTVFYQFISISTFLLRDIENSH